MPVHDLVLVDLIPPGAHDPQGMHGAIWDRLDDEPYLLPPGEPLTLASYVAERLPQAYLEHLALGSPLIDMPLFLNPDRYINLPLESTYQTAYRLRGERIAYQDEAMEPAEGAAP